MAHQLQLYGSRGTNTLEGIVHRYAPASDRNNDVGSYIADLSQRTGYAPYQVLDLNNVSVVEPLVRAITAHENGYDPYAYNMERSSVAAGLGAPPGPYSTGGSKPTDGSVHVEISMPNAPAGTKAKTSTTGNTTASVRIGYSQVGAMA
ncbi:hypothetical protein EO087_05375 [Dyella sp. M7H15-1]|uniref:hypothetical protein n=1 Tax=Dyella sp. M7H15-1 TaxID=2501295 RepID=UPI001004E0C4|nr:hypothetical protein [Dyella sp. M7H15-1]QAU23481.1 hypothetical protein EO087_05375 [Dyella sp. M7H15-1]